VSAAAPTALITGASAGIGAIYADRLARRGWNLILAARSGDRLGEVAARVRREDLSVETIVVDLGSHSGQRQLAERLFADPSITMLVNNAGFGSTAPLLDSDPDVMAQMIELNVGAVARLANAAAKAFASRGEGTIINMASIAAVAPRILNGVYGGTKRSCWRSANRFTASWPPRACAFRSCSPAQPRPISGQYPAHRSTRCHKKS
jgi:short-subunit dehydrogenase